MAILHAEADFLPASVEQRDDPHLRGLPVVVVDAVCAVGVVVGPSVEAHALGLRAGTPVTRVRRSHPEVVVVKARPEAYEAARDELLVFLRRFATHVEPGPGGHDVFLDAAGHDHGDPAGLARALRATAHAVLGLSLTVGVGPTREAARDAGLAAGPDGLGVADEVGLLDAAC